MQRCSHVLGAKSRLLVGDVLRHISNAPQFIISNHEVEHPSLVYHDFSGSLEACSIVTRDQII